MDLKIEFHPAEADVRFLDDSINRFNIARTGIEFGGELAIFVRDSDNAILAGLYGFTWGRCTEIKTLWVREDLRHRGYGKQLLQAAEQEAQRRGSSQILLDTHSFQAPLFYQKFGYEVFGTLENCPVKGYSRYFLRKSLI